jgi:hypothetical protein
MINDGRNHKLERSLINQLPAGMNEQASFRRISLSNDCRDEEFADATLTPSTLDSL